MILTKKKQKRREVERKKEKNRGLKNSGRHARVLQQLQWAGALSTCVCDPCRLLRAAGRLEGQVQPQVARGDCGVSVVRGARGPRHGAVLSCFAQSLFLANPLQPDPQVLCGSHHRFSSVWDTHRDSRDAEHSPTQQHQRQQQQKTYTKTNKQKNKH